MFFQNENSCGIYIAYFRWYLMCLIYHLLLRLFISFESSQDEIVRAGGQVEPPGMHMIYLPYSDDIRPVEEARKIPELK